MLGASCAQLRHWLVSALNSSRVRIVVVRFAIQQLGLNTLRGQRLETD